MAYEIIWTESAWENFQKIIDYLDTEWSKQSADRFIESAMKRIDSIARQPFIGSMSCEDPTIRSIIFSKYDKLYYQIEGKELILPGIFDTRKDPALNPFR